MTKPLSPLHRPLDEPVESFETASVPISSRIARLAALDSHSLSGHQHSLGPGGASAMFTQAVQRAFVEEMAAQLRGSAESVSEIGQWAWEIITAFCEE